MQILSSSAFAVMKWTVHMNRQCSVVVCARRVIRWSSPITLCAFVIHAYHKGLTRTFYSFCIVKIYINNVELL